MLQSDVLGKQVSAGNSRPGRLRKSLLQGGCRRGLLFSTRCLRGLPFVVHSESEPAAVVSILSANSEGSGP